MLNKLSTLRSRGASEEGFTLIELIIVVVIIGILAAIAIPIFLNQQKSALAAGVKSDVRNTNTNIATALVKNPTAGTVEGEATGPQAGTGAATVTVGSTTAAFVISDAATTLDVDGTWQGYTIAGSNTGLTGSYTFDSAQVRTLGPMTSLNSV